MGFWNTALRGAAAVGTGGLSEVAIRGGGAAKGFFTPPDSPDYQGVAAQQQQYNRPNQSTTFGSSAWEREKFSEPPPPAGSSIQDFIAWQQRKQAHEQNAPWKQNVALADPLQGAAGSLMGQAQGQLSNAMDWEQFGKLGTGDEARQQAIEASYGQAMKRINPAFAQRGDALKTQLLNQGLDPNSQAGRAAMADLRTQQLDATQGAMNSAILAGNQAGNDVFRNDMMRRQQMIAEALKQRGMPMEELRGFLPFMQMPGVGQDNSMLQAAGMQGDYDLNRWGMRNKNITDSVKGATEIGKAAFGAGA